MRWILSKINLRKLIGIGGIVIALAVAATCAYWWPTFSDLVDRALKQQRASSTTEDAHAGHDHGAGAPDDHEKHDHAGHSESTSLELNAQALKNLGLSSENFTADRSERL